ncbi:hypothetical protein ALC62_11801 [Cyphomyrmex costatus]|uniref:Uncharacterized protein n=1 Tax=Cyphomyrmex costatus TaxID=456900 RepID=A0A195C9L1_9HYME|nr:hypothetical protein ALC62_11801 [Cyphomyrmex costatus]
MASKKKHVEKLPIASLAEPVRKSVLDVIQYNLRAIGYKMENIIQDLHMDYNNMPITGLFLVYPSYYIHILEAWEDIIYKHYELMYAMNDDECKFGKAILLPSYHHVHQRFFSGWCHVYMIPLTLIGTLEAYALDEILKQVSNCLIKVYTLCEYIANATLVSFDFTVDRRSRRATKLGRQSGPISPREHSSRVSLEREFARAQNHRGVFANVFRCIAECILGW